MAFLVGELVANMTINDAPFRRKIRDTHREMDDVASKASRMAKVASAGLTTLAATTTAVTINLAKQGIAYNALEQKSRAALKTILGSQTQVNNQMRQLNELVQKSPFDKRVFITGQQQLLSFGMAAKKVIPTMDALQNAVAATGGSSQQLADLTFIMAQIQAAGKITGQDLLQFGQRGINAAELIGKAMGKTGAQIKSEISNGTLKASDALDALRVGMSQKFAGAADNVKQTWEGVTQRVGAQTRYIGAAMVKYLVRPAGGGDLVRFTNAFADALASTKTKMNQLVDMAYPKFTRFINTGINGMRAVNKYIATFDVRRISLGLNEVTKYTPAVAGLAGAIGTMGLKSIPVLSRFTGALNPTVGAIVALCAASPQLRAVGIDFLKSLAPVKPVLVEIGTGIGSLTNELIRILAPALLSTGHAAGDLIVAFAPTIPTLIELARALEPIVALAADVAGEIASLPTPVLATAIALKLLSSNVGRFASMGDTLAKWFTSAQKAVTGLTNAFTNTGKGAAGAGSVLAGAFGGPAGLAVSAGIGLMVAALISLNQKQAEAKRKTDELTHSIMETGQESEETKVKIKNLVSEDDISKFESLGISADVVTQAIQGNSEAIEKINQAIANSGDVIQVQAGNLTGVGGVVRKEHEDLNRVLADAQKTYRESSDSARQLASDLQKEAQAADEAAKKHKENADVKRAAIDANYAYQDAQDSLNKVMQDGFKFTGDLNNVDVARNKINRDGYDALANLAEAGRRRLETMQKEHRSQADINAARQEQINLFNESAAAMGATNEQAQKLLASMGGIPAVKQTSVKVTVDDTEIDLLDGKLNERATKIVTADPTPANASIAVLEELASRDVIKKVDVDTIDALAKNGALNNLIELMATKKIDANTDKGKAEIKKFVDQIQNDPAFKELCLTDEGALNQLADFTKKATAPVKKPVDANTSKANDKIAETDRKAAKPVKKTVEVSVWTKFKDTVKGWFGYASGGAIVGAGSATSDSIPAMLSNGEHVLTAREVKALGGQGNVYRMRRLMESGKLKNILGYAHGGAIGYARGGKVKPQPKQPQTQMGLSVQSEGIQTAQSELETFNSFLKTDLAPNAQEAFSLIGQASTQALDTQLTPAAQNMRATWQGAAQTLSNQVVPSAIQSATSIGTALKTLNTGQSAPAAAGVRTAWQNTTTVLSSQVAPATSRATSSMGSGFQSFRNTVSHAMSGVASASARPINFVIGTVYNSGLRNWFNRVAGAVGIGQRLPATAGVPGYAKGGILPGYTPGRDVHRFYSPTGGILDLSGGEGIIRPDALKALGGKAWLDEVNRRKGQGYRRGDFGAARQAYASGGIFRSPSFASASAALRDKDKLLSDAFENPVGTIQNLLTNPARAALAMGSVPIPALAGGTGKTPLPGIENWWKKAVDKLGGSGMALVNMARRFLGTPYVWGGSSIPPGLDCSGLVYYSLNHMGKHAPRLTAAGFQAASRTVSTPMPGDLLFWGSPAHHVAIYAGHNQLIEEPKPGLSARQVPLRPYTNAGRYLTRANGGPVYGRGTSTSDSILTFLSNGEHVISAREVQALGGHRAVEQIRAGSYRPKETVKTIVNQPVRLEVTMNGIDYDQTEKVADALLDEFKNIGLKHGSFV